MSHGRIAAPANGIQPLRRWQITGIRRPSMSNRAIWNVRLRHEWLRKPKKGARLKNRDRVRLGMKVAAAQPPKAD